MAAKVRYSGAYILPEFVQRSLHTRLWHRFILAPFVFLYSFATFDFEIIMPPLVFEILMPPFFMPPPEDLKSLCHPLLCHPQKTLCHPVYATPRGGIKKGGVALKKNQWPYGEGRSPELAGLYIYALDHIASLTKTSG